MEEDTLTLCAEICVRALIPYRHTFTPLIHLRGMVPS